MEHAVVLLILVGVGIFALFGGLTLLSHVYSLNGIKGRTVGDGQHGTARFASRSELKRTYTTIPFCPAEWRRGKNRPTVQGIIVGCQGKGKHTFAMVEQGDVHCLMIGAAGCGKTAYFLLPNLEYALASGMSFLVSDTKGDLIRWYGNIARECYGYRVALIDLRNPTRSDGFNLLYLVNRYMDVYLEHPDDIAAKAHAEKYAKITAKTIISSGGDSAVYGANAFFYDAAEGLLTAAILLIAEFAPKEQRHIVSVFKLIQELLAPSTVKGKNQFQLLMERLPSEHKAKWFAGAALNTSEAGMQSVMSTVLSKLNAFLDSEMEQLLCFDTAVDAETFCAEKSAIFITMPEENPVSYFMVSLIIQQLYREILAVADANRGKLRNRVMFYADEFGTLPPIASAEMMFSASRSRRLSIVAIIQSYQQLEKSYGREGSAVICDNCQLALAGGFAPGSESAERISKALGSRTVLSGSVSRGRNEPSQSLQMISRPLMTADELKAMKKGWFVVLRTGANPFISRLRLFFEWGIQLNAAHPYMHEDNGKRTVAYASKEQIVKAITAKYPPPQRKAADMGNIPLRHAFLPRGYGGVEPKQPPQHKDQEILRT